jgi:hypothetical protein
MDTNGRELFGSEREGGIAARVLASLR